MSVWACHGGLELVPWVKMWRNRYGRGWTGRENHLEEARLLLVPEAAEPRVWKLLRKGQPYDPYRLCAKLYEKVRVVDKVPYLVGMWGLGWLSAFVNPKSKGPPVTLYISTLPPSP